MSQHTSGWAPVSYEPSEKDLKGKKPSYPSLAVEFCGIKMKNPIVAASGTFGFGLEYADYLDLSNEVGAISVKGLTPEPRHGNPGTRIAETPSGVLNCIGLENPGAEAFVTDILPLLRQYDVPILANISASHVEDYAKIARTGCGFRCGRLTILIPLSLRDIPLFKGDKMNNNKPTLKRFS